ncbi:sialin-like [Branchiostoma floridae]|uniref:Sialin-like n=1 Tax=Branchiostoma floridae TaxID=7739 RepID=A0A9J7KLK9_BRAFL|nr:sialin-like [Branchiostoma floridae]
MSRLTTAVTNNAQRLSNIKWDWDVKLELDTSDKKERQNIYSPIRTSHLPGYWREEHYGEFLRLPSPTPRFNCRGQKFWLTVRARGKKRPCLVEQSTVNLGRLTKNGLLSALPSLLAMISMMLSSFLADYLIKRGTIPKVWIRRSFVITGVTGMVICGLVLANLSGCDPAAAVALLCLLQAFSGLTNAGFRAVHVEFAPRFSGVTFALANTAGTLPGIFAPMLVGFIVENDPTVGGWSKIFYIGAAIQAVGCVFTAVFMRTDVQPWARGEGDAKNTGPAHHKDTTTVNGHAEMTTKFLEEETNA